MLGCSLLHRGEDTLGVDNRIGHVAHSFLQNIAEVAAFPEIGRGKEVDPVLG